MESAEAACATRLVSSGCSVSGSLSDVPEPGRFSSATVGPVSSPWPQFMTATPEVLVVGVGIIGLSTAIRLAELGAKVVIVTEHEPQDTTSALATAMVGPTFAPPASRLRVWENETLREVSAVQDLGAGVHSCRGRFASRFAGVLPPGAEKLSRFQPCSDTELPNGFHSGFWAEVPLVNMPLYVDHLLDRFKRAGGAVEYRAIASLIEAASLSPMVVNCSGLGARYLVPDSDVAPIRGPKIIVANPGIETFFMEGPPSEEWTSIHPHGDFAVLGGSSRSSDDTTPSPAEARTIIDRCTSVEPRLAGAEVIEHRVGLRPGRSAIRLEREVLNGSTIVHNYGHGGVGVTLSWGCAHDVVALLGLSAT
jgi:D-amino-acid oxidase